MGVFTGTADDETIIPGNISGTVIADPLGETPGEGADTLNGFNGDDSLDGGGGDDVVLGGSGDDTLLGGEGDDFLDGGLGDNFIDGGSGDDTIASRGFGDFVEGGDGADLIQVYSEDSTVLPSLGDDTIHNLSGNPFALILRYEDLATSVVVDLGLGKTTGAGFVDTFSGVHRASGSDVADTLLGGGNEEYEAFDDSDGADFIDGRSGFDELIFNIGDVGTLPITIDFTTGEVIDTFGNTDRFANIEAVRATMGADVAIGSGQEFERFRMLAGADTVIGGDGFDRLDYSRDASYGGSAGVSVNLALGFAFDGWGDLDQVSGIEQVRGTTSADILIGDSLGNSLQGELGEDSIDGGAGVDSLAGGDGRDTLLGRTGDDVLEGGTGNDRLDGGANDDSLSGGDGRDNMLGGTGNDTLQGGRGPDTLTGGAGADRFVYGSIVESAPATPDVIAGFDGPGAAAGDLIDVSAIDANGGLAGDPSFVFGSTARGGLWLAEDGADTLVFVNIDADAEADFILRIQDGATLASAYTAVDFAL